MSLLVTTNLKAKLDDELNNQGLKALDVICSYVKNTGVDQLWQFFAKLKRRNVKVRMITTLQLGISELNAIKRLKENFSNIDIQVFCPEAMISFHAKGWLFKNDNEIPQTAFVGSSNISRSALLNAVEWNVRSQANESERMKHICNSFERTFNQYWHEQDSRFEGNLIRYSAETHARLEQIQQHERLKVSDLDDENSDPEVVVAAKALRQAQADFIEACARSRRNGSGHQSQKRRLQVDDTEDRGEPAQRKSLSTLDSIAVRESQAPVDPMEAVEYSSHADAESESDQHLSTRMSTSFPVNEDEAEVRRLLVTGNATLHLEELFSAVMLRNITKAKLLLEWGLVDANIRNDQGDTPLFAVMYCWEQDMSEAAAMMEVLIREGKANVNLLNRYGFTALYVAVNNWSLPLVRVLLKDGRADANMTRNGGSPLAHVAQYGRASDMQQGFEHPDCTAMAKLLLDVGNANVNSQDYKGNTPLMEAAQSDNLPVVDLILNTGKADVDKKNNKGETALELARLEGHDAMCGKLLNKGRAKQRANAAFNVMAWAKGQYSQSI